jgi:hypothetical protein
MRDTRTGWSSRLLEPILRRFQADRASMELETLAVQELDRLAQDVGVDRATLRALAARGPHAADLLPARLASLGLDPERIAYRDPGVSRDLERVCAFCDYKHRCAADLGASGVPAYCPNADTLRVLLVETGEGTVH